jgi:nicotinamidase-related amidase
MKPALLVIDVQKGFFKHNPATTASLESAIEYINEAIKIFRKKQLPVVCIQHINTEGGPKPGEEGFETPETLNVLPTDLHIHKTYSNAFNKTPLAEKLREQGVDTVILTGFLAEGCVLSTCRGAKDLDLTPIILRGSIASGDPKNIRFVEAINELISYGALVKMLE